MIEKADEYISVLKMESHPEGGYFSEIYRSPEKIDSNSLPDRYNNSRCLGTLIYYLLKQDQQSGFHRLESDEIWHHLDGCTVKIHTIDPSGKYKLISLGKDVSSGQVPQFVIPRNTWFAAGLADLTSFALLGCTVLPGFEFDDFQLASRRELLELFPQHEIEIKRFTRE